MLRLKEILEKKGMSENDLANKLGVSRQYVNAIVKERRSCSMQMLKRLAEILDVPVASLFDSYVPPVTAQMFVGSVKIPNTVITLFLFQQRSTE
jgi:transcriptional regulator with XRE-family HTH domain